MRADDPARPGTANAPATAGATPPTRARRVAKWVLNHPIWGRDGARAAWLIALFGGLFIALLWAGVLTRLAIERQLIREGAIRQVENVAAMLEQRTLLTINNADAVAHSIKHQYEREGRIDVGNMLAEGLVPPHAYLAISIVDASGHIVASKAPAAIGLDVADREYFLRHKDTDTALPDISKPVMLRAIGQEAVQVTRRLNNPDGSFAGIVALSVDPATFTELYNRTILGDSGTLALVGTDGVDRARSAGAIATPPQLAASALAERSADAPVGYFDSSPAADGSARMVAYRRLHDFPLVVMASLAEGEVLAPYYERRRVYLWGASLVTVVMVIFFAITATLAWFLKESRLRAWERARELALASKVYETTADGIMITDRDDRIIMINAAFTRLTGYAAAELLGKPVMDSPFRPLDPTQALARQQDLQSGRVITGETERVAKDGSTLALWITATSARDRDGTIANYVRVFTDIAGLKATQAKLEELASFDILTGLPNRRLLQDRLMQALLRAQRHQARVAVMFIDLDGFKAVNDTLGHAAGDELLRATAARLQACLRANDTLARFGGDEFVIILEDTNEHGPATVVGQRILAALLQPVALGSESAQVSASIGIASFPEHGMDAGTLLANADAAMYRAKSAGRNRVEVFTVEHDKTAT